MKNKYVMIGGFAFTEESDMEKLKNYAKEGWILDKIVGGFFYKLRKAEPQNIVYSLDYQNEANEEYFDIFKEAGWTPVVSVENQMYIFSAQEGTKPIYSDSKTEIDKYIKMRNQMKKGSIVSSVIGLVLIALLVLSAIFIKPIFIILELLLLVNFVIFIFNFMPYIAYNSRIKQMKKYGKCNSELISSKSMWKIYGFSGLVLLATGIVDLMDKEGWGPVGLILGIWYVSSAIREYKKYKKSLKVEN
ncbi:hypothetical protein J2Z44_002916 [Clostridium punense]|uniref:DUF2812 domain-containing protein n=1 Tax=Clostridium punense TaxID=1054297 RepID=A0ABS4K5M1_9CLOT|nr:MULTISPECIES: DUF2812 domain-containing protein [Clostridium]EQB86419.1 hypothetical protein M918_14640 [Clostridium sp. BL8]MBP2023082.1 hypothetical protein [Clostridium punense]